jgi:hypothetical protein
MTLNTGHGDQQIEWASPWNYPTRVDDALATRIAELIAGGASFAAAAMHEHVMPSRFHRWMKWGDEAYQRDAGPEDHHAQYLNLFLKVGQAVAIAAVTAQQDIFLHNPAWWLSHHPELRAEWGGDSEQAIIMPQTTVEADVPQITAPPASVDEIRHVLRTLAEAGAATVRPDTVESDEPSDVPEDRESNTA